MYTPNQQQQIRSLLEKSPFCGCGSSGDAKWGIVKEILERREPEDYDQRISLYDAAVDATSRWVEFAAHIVDHMGLMEHGGGIGSSWLTDSGETFLVFLREFGINDDEWPEWATEIPEHVNV